MLPVVFCLGYWINASAQSQPPDAVGCGLWPKVSDAVGSVMLWPKVSDAVGFGPKSVILWALPLQVQSCGVGLRVRRGSQLVAITIVREAVHIFVLAKQR